MSGKPVTKIPGEGCGFASAASLSCRLLQAKGALYKSINDAAQVSNGLGAAAQFGNCNACFTQSHVVVVGRCKHALDETASAP